MFEMGAFSTMEKARAAAQQDAEATLHWRKTAHSRWRGYDPDFTEGDFYFFERKRLQ